MIWLNIGLPWKITKICCSPLFFMIHLCSAASIECSSRDFLNDMAEHRPILKNNRNTYRPRLDFTPKTGIAFPKTRFSFLLWCGELRVHSDADKLRVACGKLRSPSGIRTLPKLAVVNSSKSCRFLFGLMFLKCHGVRAAGVRVGGHFLLSPSVAWN